MNTGLSTTEVSQLADLNAEYWLRVDRPAQGSVAELYNKTGQMVFGDFKASGRREIQEFFTARNSRVPPRVTRHVSTNIRIRSEGDGKARIHSIVSVYAGIGDLPIVGCMPVTILDFEDVCDNTSAGWLYSQRCGKAIFIGPGAAPFLTYQLPEGHPLKTDSF